jgi:cobalt/nickel transport system ATP-binding protein
LFYILSGIIKPQKGSVQILGIESEYKKFNPSIGYVFQQAEDMLFNPTVFDEIAFGLLNLGLSEEETAKRVLKTLNDFGIEELSDRPPLHLSGGEKRMLSIASVMAMEPDVLLFDEPNNDLDSYTRRFLIEIINKNAATKLIASHDLEFILETCNKTVVLNRGRIYGAGKSEDILSDKKLMRECHLEVPASLKMY